MQAKVKVWLETDGGSYLLGPGALRLLVAVHQTGSLKAGAKAAGLSYRGAWERIKKAEAGLGFALLERQSGGDGGGHSVLTAEAKRLIERYQAFLEGLHSDIETRFQQAFGSGS